jgi:hypothetical protein
MIPRAWRVVPLVLGALGAAACTRNPYVIGTICPPVGVSAADAGAADPRCGSTTPPPPDAGGTLAVGLSQSGTSSLGSLELSDGTMIPATLRLRGERATDGPWPSEGTVVLAHGLATPSPNRPAPFTDGTGAVGLPPDGPGYTATDATVGAVGSDDFALEVVLRAVPGAIVLDKNDGHVGWSLRDTMIGQLELDVTDGTNTVPITSDTTLVTGAWYHCLFWVSHASGGRVDCDGSQGTTTSLAPLGSLDAPGALLNAGGGGASVDLAHVALFRTVAGGLGDPAHWLEVSARRFAKLTGVYPDVAMGTALPVAGLRGSVAYLDLHGSAGGPSHLFLVGADWPRIACRPDAAGDLSCGYLAEPRRARAVPADASGWQATRVNVTASPTPFLDGELRFATLAPTTSGTHAISMMATAGSQNQVFSFFVHFGTVARVGASAGTAGTAVFDLQTKTVVSQPQYVRATIEPWGGGIFRCTYALTNAAGPTTYTVHLLEHGAGVETFTGAANDTIDVAGLQVDDGLVFAGSLLAADPQPGDRLTFVADDGNLPTGAAGVVDVSLLLPAGDRITDQAIINVNRDGTYDDQVQLFVRGDKAGAGKVKFWRLVGGATHWAFDGALPVTDGGPHALAGSWDSSSAHLLVDGHPSDMSAQLPNTDLAGLNRIDVGFSQASSGALEGLVFGLRIGAM